MSISVSEIFFELVDRPLGFDVEDDPEGDNILVRAFTVPGCAAERKGLRIGDRIEKMNGTATNCLTRAAFTAAVRALPEGTPIKIAVSRPNYISVQRGALHEHEFTFTKPGSLGMMLTDSAVTVVENDWSPSVPREKYAVQVNGFQSQNSTAASRGIRVGDVLRAVNGDTLSGLNYDTAMRAVTAAAGARPLTLSLMRIDQHFEPTPRHESDGSGRLPAPAASFEEPKPGDDGELSPRSGDVDDDDDDDEEEDDFADAIVAGTLESLSHEDDTTTMLDSADFGAGAAAFSVGAQSETQDDSDLQETERRVVELYTARGCVRACERSCVHHLFHMFSQAAYCERLVACDLHRVVCAVLDMCLPVRPQIQTSSTGQHDSIPSKEDPARRRGRCSG